MFTLSVAIAFSTAVGLGKILAPEPWCLLWLLAVVMMNVWVFFHGATRENGFEIQCSGSSEYDEGASVAECVVSDREAVSGTSS